MKDFFQNVREIVKKNLKRHAPREVVIQGLVGFIILLIGILVYPINHVLSYIIFGIGLICVTHTGYN